MSPESADARWKGIGEELLAHILIAHRALETLMDQARYIPTDAQ
jgi:hypothetical protein